MATTIGPGTAQAHDLAVLRRATLDVGPNTPLGALLAELSAVMERGAGATLLAQDTELSPDEAAAILLVSRPHLLAFMDAGALAFHRVGTRRRIRSADLLDFDARRKAAGSLVAQAVANTAERSHDDLERAAPITDEALTQLDDL